MVVEQVPCVAHEVILCMWNQLTVLQGDELGKIGVKDSKCD